MAEPAHRIELEIEGRSDRGKLVPLRTFARATESLTDLLAQIAADRKVPGGVEWLVSRSHEENVILTIEGRATTGLEDNTIDEIVRATVDAFETLERDGDVRDSLSYAALEKAHALASLVNDGVSAIIIRGSGHEVSLTAAAADRAESLLKKRYRSIGSVEGFVLTVSEQEAGPYFVLRERLDEYEITCRCDLTLLPRVKAALGDRVRVMGNIEQRYDGHVTSVEVTDLYVFPPREQLPQVSDIRGLFAPGELMPIREARRRKNG